MRTSRALVSIAAVLALGGCGSASSSGGGTTTGSTPGPTTTSSAAGSSSTGTGFQTPAPGGTVNSTAFTSTMVTVMRSAKTYRMTMQPSDNSQGQTIVDTVLVSDSRVDTSMTGSDMMGQEMRTVAGKTYIRADQPVNGKHWIVAGQTGDIGATVGMAGTISSGMAGLSAPMQQAFGAGTTTYIGPEAAGAHYRLVIPADTYLAALYGKSSVGQQELRTATPRLKGKNVTYDIWLDGSNRPARMRIDGTVLDQATGGTDSSAGSSTAAPSATDSGDSAASSVVVLTFTGWGKPLTISAPPATDTVPFDQAMSGLTSSPPEPATSSATAAASSSAG